MDEKTKQAWDAFSKSGSVEDYLKYNSINKDVAYGNDKSESSSNSGNQIWGK
ncbi:MAG: hypothetical protein IJC89_01535 [Clostridia bacterium]|nr:hypothetical protein [Clostridia bacterium]